MLQPLVSLGGILCRWLSARSASCILLAGCRRRRCCAIIGFAPEMCEGEVPGVWRRSG